jgi:uncharacterized protein YggU (UPF0235/DUF167 family)
VANAALLKLLARELGVPPSTIRIAGGETSRAKRIAVAGLSPESLAIRWPGLTVYSAGPSGG